VFERFDESARLAVVTAQEEARALRHPAIGGEHLLLGLADAAPAVAVHGLGAVREQVLALFGTGEAPSPAQLPFTATATEVLEGAAEEAAERGHETVRPADLLLALLRVDDRTRSIIQALGLRLDEVTARAEAASEQGFPRAPGDVHQALGEGFAVEVTLGDRLPVGDLGNPRTDARVLLALLAANGRAAELLRDHGVDEDAIRGLGP
jgi:ATP-dependent Clp protease ATP-binding subunit ClpA